MLQATEWENSERIIRQTLMGFEIAVHFTAKPAGDDFTERLRRAGFPVGTDPSAGFNFYALSSVPHPFGAYLYGHIRPQEEGSFEVGLHLRRKGKGEVSKRIAEANRLLGGYPEAMRKLTEEWGVEDEVDMEVQALIFDIRKKSKLRFPSIKLSGPVRKFKLVEETLEFKVTGLGFIKHLRVEFDPADKTTQLKVAGKVKKRVATDLFDVMNKEMLKVLERAGL